MFCPNCGFKVSDNTKFCPKCGKSISDYLVDSVDDTGKNPLKEEDDDVTNKDSKRDKPSAIEVIKGVFELAIAAVVVILFVAALTGKFDKLANEHGLAGRPRENIGLDTNDSYSEDSEEIIIEEDEPETNVDISIRSQTNLSQENDISNIENAELSQLRDDIMTYCRSLYGTNNVLVEFDHAEHDTYTFRAYDPTANATSSTMGFYSYDKKSNEWRDDITCEVLNLEVSSYTDNSSETTIEQYYVYVNAPDGYVNLRNGPGTEYEIICPIPNGEALELYPGDATSQNGKRWVKVAYWAEDDWKDGWVIASQIDF